MRLRPLAATMASAAQLEPRLTVDPAPSLTPAAVGPLRRERKTTRRAAGVCAVTRGAGMAVDGRAGRSPAAAEGLQGCPRFPLWRSSGWTALFPPRHHRPY